MSEQMRGSPLSESLDEVCRLFRVKSDVIVNPETALTHQLYDALRFVSNPAFSRRWVAPQVDTAELTRAEEVTTAQTALGKLAHTMTALESNTNVRMGGGYSCYDSEPHLLRSLDYVDMNSAEYKPATVHVDSDGKPIAFTKNSGIATTIVLRQSDILPPVPLGTIIVPGSGADKDWFAVRNESTTKLTPQLQASVLDKPIGVTVSRASVFGLPSDLVRACEYNPKSVVRHTLYDEANRIADVTLDDIVERIDAMIEKG